MGRLVKRVNPRKPKSEILGRDSVTGRRRFALNVRRFGGSPCVPRSLTFPSRRGGPETIRGKVRHVERGKIPILARFYRAARSNSSWTQVAGFGSICQGRNANLIFGLGWV